MLDLPLAYDTWLLPLFVLISIIFPDKIETRTNPWFFPGNICKNGYDTYHWLPFGSCASEFLQSSGKKLWSDHHLVTFHFGLTLLYLS